MNMANTTNPKNTPDAGGDRGRPGRHDDVLLWVSKELDGELTSQERILLTDHLQGCPPCTQARRELRGLSSVLRTHEKVLPPVGLVDRVVAHVLAPQAAAIVGPWRSLRLSAALAAAALLALGVVYIAGLPGLAMADTKPRSEHRLDPELERALTRWESAREREPRFFELLLPANGGK